MEIFRLFGSIFIENEKANKSLRDTEKQATAVGKTLQETTKAAIKFGDELGKRLTDVGSKMTKLAGIPLAALKAAMFGLAKTTADYGDRVAKASQEIGLSVEAYQELEYALGQNGVATEQFEMAIGNLNRLLGEARRGNAKYRETLKQMGFSLDDLDKGAVTTEESFMQIVEALSQMDDAQMQASLASEFFGNRVARKLMPAIRGGSEAIEELRKRAHDLGIVMDEEAARKSELFGDTMDDLGRAMGGFSRTIGSELQAPLINIAKWFTDIVAGASKWIEENPKLVRQVVMFGGAIAGVLGVLVTLGTTMIVTGKIIGALGAIFNILTSKPILIIAAIGALYLAWESDWLGIRTAVENAWAKIEPVIDAIIEWGHQTIETIWNWTTKILSKFLEWLLETAWPWINDTVETTWDWAKGTVSKFIEWIKDTAWPYIDGVAKTTWSWLAGTVDTFISWIKDTAWPVIKDGASTVWSWSKGKWDSFVEWLYAQWGFIVNGIDTIWGWSKGYIDEFVTWIYQTAWPVISGGAKTLWSWAVGALDAFISWIYETAWPWINGTVTTTWEWTVKGLDWLKKLLGIGSDGEAEGPAAIEETSQAIDEAIGKAVTLQELLDAIYRAEGGPEARVPYGMTGFEGGVKYRSEIDQARFQELAAGLEVGSEAYWRAAAQTTVEHYWRWFKTRFPELGEKTFDEVGPEIQSMFIAYLGSHFSPPEAHELNRNWVPNVLALVGFDELAQEFRAGNERVMDAWIGAIYDKAGDVEAAVEWIAGIVARYMVGTSPPPEGPLSDIDEGGA
ncbi:MAG TPA: phage tail tape measure protein, partial [Bacillota bacterium]|nr:phage tail tape measure protein [Bacillota bacterium]